MQIFKHGLKSYRELPLQHRRVRQGAPLRAVGRAARAACACAHFTQDDAHIFCTEDQLADECLKINDLILSIYGTSASRTSSSSCRRGRRSASAPTSCGTTPRSRDGDVLDEISGAGNGASRRRSIRARAPSTAPSSNTCCATPSAATGSAARRRSTSTCRAASAPSTSTQHAREEDAGDDPPRHLRLAGALHRHSASRTTPGHLPLWLAPVQVVVATDRVGRGRLRA